MTALAPAYLDRVVLSTVGIDVGSSTTHCMFATVELARRATKLSSRFEVVRRQVRWRSPVMLTPYRPDGLIDAQAVAAFVSSAGVKAAIPPGGVDTGAVILTGSALRRRNAAALAEALARGSGRLVCASAGHHLEALLAAHGSGVVGEEGLHLDVGGGTAKLAVLESDGVGPTAAVGVGGRLVAYGPDRTVSLLEEAAAPLVERAGLRLGVGDRLDEKDERRLARTMAEVVMLSASGRPFPSDLASLELTPRLPERALPPRLSVSGGVSAYLGEEPPPPYGDLGPALARALRRRFAREGVHLAAVADPLRATVAGASQFSVQVSGSTVAVERDVLPLRSVPVVSLGTLPAQLDPTVVRDRAVQAVERRRAGIEVLDPPALALRWQGPPSHERVLALASGLSLAWAVCGYGRSPLVVVIDSDLGASLGHLLRGEARHPGPVVVLDGLEAGELDHLDAGAVLEPAGVVPVVVRSLLFAPERDSSGSEKAPVRRHQ